MARVTTKIDESLHEKMKRCAAEHKRSVYEEYSIALSSHLSNEAQKTLLADTMLENYFNERMTRMENHLASMLGRTGMDTSMVLMGLLGFLERYFKGQISREDLQEQLRKEAARYFSTAIKKDKDDKKALLESEA